MNLDLLHHGRVIRAAVYKSWRLSVTYPTWILNRALSPLVWVAIAVYAYIGVATPGEVAASFEAVAESPDFTGFLIVGQTVFSFFTSMNWRGGMALQRERWYGTIELLMVSPASRVAWVLGESIYGLLDGGWTIFLAMVVALYLFGADFHVAHPAAALLAVGLTLLAMVALGLFFAGFYVRTRSAGPLASAVQSPIRFFSGTQFPVAVLPALAQAVSFALPVTWGLMATRATLLDDAGLADVATQLWTLAAFAAALFVGGVWMLGRMERAAKERGTLHQY